MNKQTLQELNFAHDIAACTIAKHIDHSRSVIEMVEEGSKAQSLFTLTQFFHLTLSAQLGGSVAAMMGGPKVITEYTTTGKDNQDLSKLSLLAVYHYLSSNRDSIREAFLWALARFHEIERRPCQYDVEIRTYLTQDRPR